MPVDLETRPDDDRGRGASLGVDEIGAAVADVVEQYLCPVAAVGGAGGGGTT
jgi:hypothetical protein